MFCQMAAKLESLLNFLRTIRELTSAQMELTFMTELFYLKMKKLKEETVIRKQFQRKIPTVSYYFPMLKNFGLIWRPKKFFKLEVLAEPIFDP